MEKYLQQFLVKTKLYCLKKKACSRLVDDFAFCYTHNKMCEEHVINCKVIKLDSRATHFPTIKQHKAKGQFIAVMIDLFRIT